MSDLLRAWYVFLALGLTTFALTAFVGRAPANLSVVVALPHQAPYQAGVQVRETLSAMGDRRDLRAENERLREELARTRQRGRRLELEIARLQEVLAIRAAQSPGVETTAPVVGGAPGVTLQRLTLGAGRGAGVEAGMPVTAPAGLVGIVTEVTDARAVVRTILDPESRVGASVRGRGGQGIAVGEVGGGLRVTRYVEDDAVEVGDVVETSSYGGLFPRGVRIGVVREVLPPDPNELRREFLVEPSVEFSTLLEVALITPP